MNSTFLYSFCENISGNRVCPHGTMEGGGCAHNSVWAVMVFNATFNNISVISCRSVLLVEETGVPGENHRPVANH